MLVAVEKATSIQSFSAGSDVQTQTDIALPTRYKNSNISSQLNLTSNNNINNIEESEPYSLHGEFFTVVQNCDGTYRMGDQGLSLSDNRVSKFLQSYRPSEALAITSHSESQNMSDIFNMASFDLNQELSAKPNVVTNNTQSMPVLKPIEGKPRFVDRADSKVSEFTANTNNYSSSNGIINKRINELKNSDSCPGRKKTLCEVTFQKETEKCIMNTCMDSKSNRKLLEEFDKWSDASSEYNR